MYTYEGEMPPLEKIIAIEDFKKDGDYKILKARWGGWKFVRITGEYYPSMEELQSLKEKYIQEDVAIFLVEGAIVMLNNPKKGITFHKMTI